MNVYVFFRISIITIIMSLNLSEGNPVETCCSILVPKLSRFMEENTIDFGDI